MSKLFVSAGRILLLLIMLVLAGSSALARESILYQFPGGSGGDDPVSGIVFDNQGNAYGTTYYGGTYGWGAIFRLEPSHGGWTQQILYSFLGTNDGFNPVGNLLIDATGNLYGTTESGGNGAQCTPGYYCGTVFELARSNGGWKHLVLYNFCSLSGCSDGSAPNGLVFDKAGNLYGTAAGGGECYDGCGTVYRLSPSHGTWTERVLHTFDNNGDGYCPSPGISIDKAGRLYGTTVCGGGYGYGIVYVLNHGKRGWQEVMVYAFDGSANNDEPNGYLTLDSGGNILGTTKGGNSGCPNECGMVYKLSRSNGQWVETTLYTFDGTNGANPDAGFILDSAGNFYGSTTAGGKYDLGVVFELRPGKAWKIELLYNFTGAGADKNPNPGLTFGPGGGLYGTTPGSYDAQYYGGVFEIFQ